MSICCENWNTNINRLSMNNLHSVCLISKRPGKLENRKTGKARKKAKGNRVPSSGVLNSKA